MLPTRDEPHRSVYNRERTKTVVLQFVEELVIVERFSDPRASILQGDLSAFQNNGRAVIKMSASPFPGMVGVWYNPRH